jgi:FkbM family methyltransferase
MNKFYGQFDPPVDQFIFERYFPDKSIRGTFVECGAFDGLTECSCKFFEESMGWTGYNLEPVPWIFEQLCENRPNSKNLNYALSNTIGEATFKAVDHPQFGINCTNGSLNHTEAHYQALKDAGCQLVDVKVNLRTWSDFIEKENISHIDLLVLDVEGHELSVIDGIQESDVLPDVLCIEVGHIHLEKIRDRLDRLGYIYDISSHVNAYFVKREMAPLFALRQAVFTNQTSRHTAEIGMLRQEELMAKHIAEIEILRQGELTAKQKIEHLEHLVETMQQSKSWRLIQLIRRIIFFGKR